MDCCMKKVPVEILACDVIKPCAGSDHTKVVCSLSVIIISYLYFATYKKNFLET